MLPNKKIHLLSQRGFHSRGIVTSQPSGVARIPCAPANKNHSV